MAKKTTILAIDSDDAVLNLYRQHAKEQGYKTVVANSAEQALVILQQVTVDLIISDVLLSEMDGHEFCRQVKADEKTKDIPFIFVSSVTELDELVVGYSLGADDYIHKPIVYDELILKVKSLIENYQQNGEIKEQLDEYYNTAMQAMTYSSELGQILEFYKACALAKSFKDLANYLFITTNMLGLKCSLQIYDLDNQSIGFCECGALPPIEKDLMLAARKQTRFFDFGKRTILNYTRFSFLIKNMPLEDAEKYGRLKDILGTLADALESRIDILFIHSAAKQKREVVEMVSTTMMDIDSSFAALQKENIAALEDMMEDMEEVLLLLGLTEYQEESVMKISKTCLSRINNAFYKGVEINTKLEVLHKQLVTIID
ncbi:hypothetical protein MNBD_GAMMA23-1384 [hydrothermal vent metagenome]|uniref:Response regulatory domain-containing protein n=1 Tax=hydrothermal vent metagenome TaxID=652676 RepID=A0A3B0ZTS3_9ZZZZ